MIRHPAARAALLVLLLLPAAALATPQAGVTEVMVDPPKVRLVGPGAVYSLLVSGKTADGRWVDLTHVATYHALQPDIAAVTPSGVVQAKADGAATVAVEVAGRKLTVAVEVKDAGKPRTFHFENDIIPILSRYGCNAAGCHGAAEGQNGFKLSVFGFDPAADYAALVKEGRGRRVLFAAPEHSLLLTKPSGAVPHGGGIRIRAGTAEYETLRAWVAAGAPFGDASAAHVESIRVEPAERVLPAKGRQQLRVIARWSDGREADVTAFAKFQVNNSALGGASVTGLVTVGDTPGELAVMASYLGNVATFRATVPRAGKAVEANEQPAVNFIDTLVFARLKRLNIAPSGPASDAEFLRRVYLDVIGTLPTPAETRKFLADKRADRRARLVDELLERPEFADYWALKWADLLRVDRQALGHKRAYAYYRWIQGSLAANKPLDQFAREIVTAEGSPEDSAPAAFYKVVTKPGDRAGTLSQVFLGVRIACAECHHHPYERWGQTDYYGMTAYFAPLAFKPSPRGELLVASGAATAKHPRTGQMVPAFTLGTKLPAAPPAFDGDPRLALADWMVSADNPWFARNLANRVWAHFLGRGLVEPVDDVRDTNPPSHPELLDALAKDLAGHKFDLKHLIRTITASHVYQLSTKPNATNADDELNFSRALFRRIDAEVLLDMVSQTTGVPERFEGMPAGTRAIQLWDSKTNHYFLKLFGRPSRASACECERVQEPGVSQVLHLMNSPEIQAKLSHPNGTVAKLVQTFGKDGPLVEELYLTFLCRLPTDTERATAAKYLARFPGQRQQAAEDLAWGLLNSLEFVFQR